MTKSLILSKIDRIFLINQLRILEILYPDESNQFSVKREALERGYELLYDSNYSSILDGDDILTKKECIEVWNTMNMFAAIQKSMPKNMDISKFPMTKFVGYDAITEAKFMNFAQYTVERLKKFEYVTLNKLGNWNSNHQVRSTYLRMLKTWSTIPPRERLAMTLEQISLVLTSAIDMENR